MGSQPPIRRPYPLTSPSRDSGVPLPGKQVGLGNRQKAWHYPREPGGSLRAFCCVSPTEVAMSVCVGVTQCPEECEAYSPAGRCDKLGELFPLGLLTWPVRLGSGHRPKQERDVSYCAQRLLSPGPRSETASLCLGPPTVLTDPQPRKATETAKLSFLLSYCFQKEVVVLTHQCPTWIQALWCGDLLP